MVILAIYTNHIKVKYKSTLLSKATFFVFSCGMLSLVLPFILAYKSGGFWLKRDVFHEQPQISLTGDYLLIAATSNLSNPVICSTFPYFIENLEFLDVCSIIKLREIDDNFDGKTDKISLNIRVNIFNNALNSINLILPVRYKLTTVCPIQMQAGVIYQQYLQTAATHIKIVGDLSLFQSSPVQCYKRGTYDLFDYPIIASRDAEYEIGDILEKYWERNISTQLTNVYTSVVSGSSNSLDINLTVRYPEHKIYYKPHFWQIIKLAWMQYLSIYVVTAWVLSRIKRYVFTNRLVLFYKEPVPEKSK